ncbi:hypothetical protein ACIQMJ_20960 [Actinosynnema sp. NPDC091369]
MRTPGEEPAASLREGDRVAEALLAMEDHPGHRLLRGAELTGGSARRWAVADAGMVRLWEWFDAYRAVLGRVADARDPAEVARLLHEPVITVPGAERTLTGPVPERITLRALVTRMRAEYAQVTAVLTEAHEAWSRRLGVLVPLVSQVEALDPPVAARLRAEVAGARARAMADPLTPDPAVADLVERVASASALHRTFPARVAALSRLVAEVESVRTGAARVRAEVVATIAGEHPEVPGDDVAGALDGLRGRFPDVAESDVAAVESAVGSALARARGVVAHLTGSLDRRVELRGRLDAYRAKAAGRGFAEDAELSALHRRARDVLSGVPCDLNAGTVAVRRYQRAVPARTEGR